MNSLTILLLIGLAFAWKPTALNIYAYGTDATTNFACISGKDNITACYDATGTSVFTVNPPAAATGHTQCYGSTVKISNNYVFVSDWADTTDASSSSGCIHVYARSTGDFVQTLRYTETDFSSFSYFGDVFVVDPQTDKVFVKLGMYSVWVMSGADWATTYLFQDPEGSDIYISTLAFADSILALGEVGYWDNYGRVRLFNATDYSVLAEFNQTESSTLGKGFGEVLAMTDTELLIGTDNSYGSVSFVQPVYHYHRSGADTWELIDYLTTNDQSRFDRGVADYGVIFAAGNTVLTGMTYSQEYTAGGIKVFTLGADHHYSLNATLYPYEVNGEYSLVGVGVSAMIDASNNTIALIATGKKSVLMVSGDWAPLAVDTDSAFSMGLAFIAILLVIAMVL